MTNEYLKPCPFCGGKAKIHRTYKGETEVASKIVCIDCLAVFYQAEANSAEENIEAWNKRPADQKPQPKKTSLDGLIADAAATLDHLRLLRDILNTGDCNECKNKDCQHKPIVGERVRYNCYDFKK